MLIHGAGGIRALLRLAAACGAGEDVDPVRGRVPTQICRHAQRDAPGPLTTFFPVRSFGAGSSGDGYSTALAVDSAAAACTCFIDRMGSGPVELRGRRSQARGTQNGTHVIPARRAKLLRHGCTPDTGPTPTGPPAHLSTAHGGVTAGAAMTAGW